MHPAVSCRRPSVLVAVLFAGLALGPSLAPLRAADAAAAAPVAADAALAKRAEGKAERLLKGLKLEDAARAERARGILAAWYQTLWAWHREHDAELGALWSEWGKARAVVPKDEFPGEVIAHRIDDLYGSLRPAYQEFLTRLAVELTPAQVDALKEAWSRSPGLERTYKAYLEIAPGLTPEQQQVIHDRLARAREAAMLTDADKEIVNLFKVQKVKVEAFIGSLEWAKLHAAFANKGKAPAAPAEPKK